MAKTYDKVRYIETSGFNPHYNLALESALMDAAKDGELIVYLWRNDNTNRKSTRLNSSHRL